VFIQTDGQTDRQTDGHCYIDSAIDADQEYIYFMGSPYLKKVQASIGFVLTNMCVTDRRRHGRPYKLYIFLISINSQVDIAISVSPSV